MLTVFFNKLGNLDKLTYTKRRGNIMQKQFIFLILLSILVAIFAITNANIISVQLFLWSFQLSGSLVILISVALGASLVLLLGLYRSIKTRMTIRDLEKNINNLKTAHEVLITEHKKTLQENEVLKAEVNQLQNSIPKQTSEV
jgi:lipopolysaccharide assembly protein A